MLDEDKVALAARAEALGIDVDKRWGAARLASEIAIAEARTETGASPPLATDAAPEVADGPAEAAPGGGEPEAGEPEASARLIPTRGEPDLNDPRLDGRAIVEAALLRQQVE